MSLVNTAQLNEVAEIILGQSPQSETLNKDGKGLPYFHGRTDFGEVSPVDTRWCSSPPKIAESGDILISVRAPVGRTNLATKKCCIGRGLAAIRADQSKLDTGYLRFMLKKVEPELVSKAQQSATGAIGKGDLASICFPLPTLTVQCHNANMLLRAENIVQMRREAQIKSAEIVAETFLEMFGDPKTNIMGWATVPFGSVGTLARGKSRRRTRNAQLWPAGTLCIVISANNAKTDILEFDDSFPSRAIIFVPDKSIKIEFVQAWLESLRPQTASRNITLETMRNLLLPLPPMKLQLEFVNKVEQIRTLQAKQSKDTAEAQNAFNTLLEQIFSVDSNGYRS
jgi:restriction endonuclease S subunit